MTESTINESKVANGLFKLIYLIVALLLIGYTYKYIIQDDMIDMFYKEEPSESTAILMPNSGETVCIRTRQPMSDEIVINALAIEYDLELPNADTAIFTRPCVDGFEYQYDFSIN